MVIDTMFSGESKNIEYKIILPDQKGKRMVPIFVWQVHPDRLFQRK